MIFTDDTTAALNFVAALADTVPEASESGEDELATTAQLDALLDAWLYSGRRDGDARELAEVVAARERLRALWALDRDDAVVEVNAILAESTAVPRLVRHDTLDWHIHATSLDAPLAERILVEAAMALVDVIRAAETDRMRACAADDCTGIFLDLSKNGSRRFCSTRCGNRMAVGADRARPAGVGRGAGSPRGHPPAAETPGVGRPLPGQLPPRDDARRPPLGLEAGRKPHGGARLPGAQRGVGPGRGTRPRHPARGIDT